MTILTTKRLRLEPCTEAHLEGLDALNSDIEVMRYITGIAITLEETKAHIEVVKELWKTYGYSSWSIFELKTNQFIGTGGIQHLEFNPENPLEIGWRLIPSKWKQGFATEAAQCMMEYAFATLGIDALRAVCHQENIKSAKVMQRLGMRFRGLEKWYNLDTIAYGMTKEEFMHNRRSMLAATAA